MRILLASLLLVGAPSLAFAQRYDSNEENMQQNNERTHLPIVHEHQMDHPQYHESFAPVDSMHMRHHRHHPRIIIKD